VGVPGYKTTRDSIRYGFAVGKVRVLETRVFGHGTYERLIDAGTFAEQRRILSDTVYGRYLEGAETAAAVERGLTRALDDFYGFLDEASLPPAVVRFFRSRHDFANLKGALKARLLAIPAEGLLVELGTVPVEAFERDLAQLPAPLGPLAEELLAVPQNSRDAEVREIDLADVDAAVDRAMFAELRVLARESRSAFLRGLAALQIDIANVRACSKAAQLQSRTSKRSTPCRSSTRAHGSRRFPRSPASRRRS
jgi:vacuolar-type H+-ATPase subunit C/Vma6